MFCKNCGKEISDDTKFCPECGTAVDSVIEENNSENLQPKKIISDLTSCYNYFIEKKDIYDFLQIGKKLINNKQWRKKVNSNFYAGVIFSIIGIIGFIPTIKVVIDSEWFLIIFLWEVLVAEIVAAVVGGICALIFGKRRSTIKFYENKIPIMENKIKEHYEKYSDCPLTIEYTNPETINTLISYMNSGRAETLKEAINLYEDECHKMQMMTEMKEMNAAAKQAATAATMAAINSL